MTLLGGSLLGSRFNQNDVDNAVEQSKVNKKRLSFIDYKVPLFSSSSQSFGQFSSPYSFDGDFYINLNIYLTSLPAETKIIIGNNDSNTDFLALTTSGQVRLEVDGVQFNTSNTVTLNKTNVITVRRLGDRKELYLNDEGVHAESAATSTSFKNVASGLISTRYSDLAISNLDMNGDLFAMTNPNRNSHPNQDGSNHVVLNNISISDWIDAPWYEKQGVRISLSSVKNLPNGAQGQNPSGGFTCTGMDMLADGRWVISNDGRPASGDTNNPSLVIMNSSFTEIDNELDLSGASLLGATSAQGVTVLPDGTLYVVAVDLAKIFHIDANGNKLGEIGPLSGINGIAYDSENSAFWTCYTNNTEARLYDASLNLLNTIQLDGTLHDHLNYDENTKRLAVTRGSSGSAGFVDIYDTVSGLKIAETGKIQYIEAIEGIYIDYPANRMWISNDGGFHTEATPPISSVYIFDINEVI